MCGIFGVVLREGASISIQDVSNLLENLYLFSESRGKESAGLNILLPIQARQWTLKGALPASELLLAEEYKKALGESLKIAISDVGKLVQPLIILAHSRLVTNGSAALARNNQPVRSGNVTMIHNGIVVNVDDIWQKNPDLSRSADVDTEIMAALLNRELAANHDPLMATRDIFSVIKGAASVAWCHQASSVLTAATNTGDLYVAELARSDGIVFASEQYILLQSMEKTFRDRRVLDSAHSMKWIPAGQGICFDSNAQTSLFHFSIKDYSVYPSSVELRHEMVAQHDLVIADSKELTVVGSIVRDADESLVKYGEERVGSLRRCSRCVLPETFPFIKFDEKGVCNYCHSYKPRYAKMHPNETRKRFIDSLSRYRRDGISPDVLVPFSGGRDSSYGLHLIHEEFGLRPVTFTYDWGMVTDLARRNIARMCGQLGIQNILVSADIKQKRENIRKNVVAWLNKPDLGMVPLFMAGDKHFFKVVNQLKRQTGIDLDLWCANPLENTDFKSGFCGVSPDFDKSRVDYLSLGRKVHLASYYASRFLSNPGYLNSSLLDTFGAFLAYYFEPRRDFYFIFDHFIWNEDEVNRTLLSKYDWELAPDSPSTWRIGDGTAPFYNYIYMTARGFTEFDTFRSNQIREGMISREAALKLIAVENRPRVESLRWYLETIGLDFNCTIQRINELDMIGLHR